MLDVEKFLVALRSNKDFDGKLKPIHLADTVQEEIKIIQAAVENSRREWVGLTDDAVFELADTNLYDGGKNYGVLAFAKAIEQALKEKNHG